jgi:hypothetical protein
LGSEVITSPNESSGITLINTLSNHFQLTPDNEAIEGIILSQYFPRENLQNDKTTECIFDQIFATSLGNLPDGSVSYIEGDIGESYADYTITA